LKLRSEWARRRDINELKLEAYKHKMGLTDALARLKDADRALEEAGVSVVRHLIGQAIHRSDVELTSATARLRRLQRRR